MTFSEFSARLVNDDIYREYLKRDDVVLRSCMDVARRYFPLSGFGHSWWRQRVEG